jgi:hypothetical protein
MDYKLANELKDAGFSQNGDGDYWGSDIDKTAPYVPTLSELIEACGARFDCLRLSPNSGKWFAVGWRDGEVIENGSTPEAAVARLWLVLNKPAQQ